MSHLLTHPYHVGFWQFSSTWASNGFFPIRKSWPSAGGYKYPLSIEDQVTSFILTLTLYLHSDCSLFSLWHWSTLQVHPPVQQKFRLLQATKIHPISININILSKILY